MSKSTDAKPSTNGTVSKPAARVLKAMRKLGKPATRTESNDACAKAGFETAKKFAGWLSKVLGQLDPKARKEFERDNHKTLIGAGLVEPKTVELDGATETKFSLTPAGRKAAVAVK